MTLLLDITLKLITIGNITFRGLVCDLIISLIISSEVSFKGRSAAFSAFLVFLMRTSPDKSTFISSDDRLELKILSKFNENSLESPENTEITAVKIQNIAFFILILILLR